MVAEGAPVGGFLRSFKGRSLQSSRARLVGYESLEVRKES